MSDIKDASQALAFLQKSGLINLETPLSKVVAQAGELEIAGRGFVFAWSQWVLITSPCPPSPIITAIGEGQAGSATTEQRGITDLGEGSGT